MQFNRGRIYNISNHVDRCPRHSRCRPVLKILSGIHYIYRILWNYSFCNKAAWQFALSFFFHKDFLPQAYINYTRWMVSCLYSFVQCNQMKWHPRVFSCRFFSSPTLMNIKEFIGMDIIYLFSTGDPILKNSKRIDSCRFFKFKMSLTMIKVCGAHFVTLVSELVRESFYQQPFSNLDLY